MLLFRVAKDASETFALIHILVVSLLSCIIYISSLLNTQSEQPIFNLGLFMQNQLKEYQFNPFFFCFTPQFSQHVYCKGSYSLGLLPGLICESSDKEPTPLPEMCLRQNCMLVSQLQGSIFKGSLYKLHSIHVGVAQCYEKSAREHRAHIHTELSQLASIRSRTACTSVKCKGMCKKIKDIL